MLRQRSQELPLGVLREQGMTTIHPLDCICKLSSHNLKSVLYTLQRFLEIHVVYSFEEIMTVLLTVTRGFHDTYQSAQRFSSCVFVCFDGDNTVT